jgi:hypothetical protein
MWELEYLTDRSGQTKAVVVPIGLWQQIFPKGNISAHVLPEAMANYSLNKAMDEAKKTPLLSREEALAYLER